MKTSLKTLVTVLALIIAISSVPFTANSAVQAPSIVIDSVECLSGETVSVSANIVSNPGISYLEVTPVWSDELTFVSVANGELFSDFTKGNQYVWISDDDVTSDGLLATMTLRIAEDAVPGEYSVNFIIRGCYNGEEQPVDLAVVPATIRCSGGKITFSYKDNTLGDGAVDHLYINAATSLGNGYDVGIIFSDSAESCKFASDGGSPLFARVAEPVNGTHGGRAKAFLHSGCYGSHIITAVNVGGEEDDDVIAVYWQKMPVGTLYARMFARDAEGTVTYGAVSSIELTDGNSVLPLAD